MKRMTRSKVWLGGALVAGGAAMFVTGAFASDAMRDNPDTKDGALTARSGVVAVAPGTSSSIPGKGGGGESAPALGVDSKLSYDGGCPGALGDVVHDGVLDLAATGASPGLLGDGFRLSAVTVRSTGDCDESGAAMDARVSFDTVWLHPATGAQVWVSQRVEPTRHANIAYEGSATFWRDGYSFNVGAGGLFRIAPADGGEEIATDLTAVDLQPVIDAALSQLAPGLDRQCFYRQAQGTWADLAVLGIGDPRSSIPTEYAEIGFQLATFTAPPASCGEPPLGEAGTVSFSAEFSAGDLAYLGVSASAVGAGEPPSPGYLNDYNASWSNGKFQFQVWAKSQEPLGRETIVAIAKALDPTFSEQCLLRETVLTAEELAAAGLRAPAVPADYALTSSSLVATGIAADCPNPPEWFTRLTYSLNWTLKGEDGTVIDVYVNRTDGAGEKFVKQEAGGYISDFGLGWVDAGGTIYQVQGSTIGISAKPPMDVLIAVAKSLDPALDVDSLQQEDGKGGASGPSKPAPDGAR